MGKLLVLIMCLAAASASASAGMWRPSERLLHAVRCVESSHGLFTWGDDGRSLGDFQLSEAAWLDVSAWRRARNLPVYNYDVHVWNRKVSRAYAADYLTILHHQLKKRLNRAPSAAEVYAAYNMGMGSFAECQYELRRVNSTTAKKCRQISAMMAGK